MTLPTPSMECQQAGFLGSVAFTSWDDSIRDVGDMLMIFVDLLVPKFPASVVFDDWQVFNWNENSWVLHSSGR